MNLELEPGELKVELTKDRLLLYENDIAIKERPLANILHSEVRSGVGVDRLHLILKEEEEDFCFFTKSRSSDFRKLAAILSSDIMPEHQVGEDTKTEKSGNRRGTLLWLVNFMRSHRRRLIGGVLLSVAIAGLNLVPPYLLKTLVDSVLVGGAGSRPLFLLLTLTLLGSYAATALLTAIQTYVLNSTGQKIVNELRGALFKHVINHTSAFIDRVSTGRIISRLTTDVGNTQWLMVWGMPSLTVNLLTLFGIGAILFTMDEGLAVYVLIPVPVIILLLIAYRRRSHRAYHRNWRRNADVIARFSDVIPNYAVVKSFSREDRESMEFNGMLDRLYESQRSVVAMNSFYWPLIALLTSLATVAIWWVGGNQVLSGHIQLGIIIAFIAYLTLFYQPINNLSNIIPFIQQAVTSGERIREVLETKPNIETPVNPAQPSRFGDISFSSVTFGYEEFQPVVRNLDLKISSGEKVAIAGKSGSGKSTIAKLILRFYDTSSGAVRIDGIDVREMDPRYIREHIGYVPQESVLFDASVSYNISYGSKRADDGTGVIASAVAAGIHEELMSLPLAYDTNLGERGNFLSGGQKQRIAIARAMFKDPEVVVFDEATSSLDAVNERNIYSTIQRLSSGRMAVFITHNLREILSSNRVIVMDNGRIVEEGNPQALLEGGQWLRDMFREELENSTMEPKEDIGGGKKLLDYVSDLFVEKRLICEPDSGMSAVRVRTADGDKNFGQLIPRLPFPISRPEFVLLYRDREPAILLRNYMDCIVSGVDVLERAIRANNLRTHITGVSRIELMGDELEWRLRASNGRELLVRTKGRRNVMLMPWGIILVDIDQNIFEMKYESLDKRSRRLVSQVV
ncbi:MAG: DUF1854 domain-containing protein [Methanomassiliicoccales archaeon]